MKLKRVDAKRNFGFFCPVPDGIEFMLGKVNTNSLTFQINGTLFRASSLPLIVIIFFQFQIDTLIVVS